MKREKMLLVLMCVSVMFKSGEIKEFNYEQILNADNWTCAKDTVCLYNNDSERLTIMKSEIVWAKEGCS